MQDPTFFRSNGVEKGRDGCRVPLPWTVDGPSFGFGSGGAHLPQPAWFGPQSVAAQESDPSSTLQLYRRALDLRRKLQAAEELEWVETAERYGAAFSATGRLGVHHQLRRRICRTAPGGRPDQRPADRAMGRCRRIPRPGSTESGRLGDRAIAGVRQAPLISSTRIRTMSRSTSSGIGCVAEKRIVPLDNSNPSSRSRSASMTCGLNGNTLR